jgi:hypothetical protein
MSRVVDGEVILLNEVYRFYRLNVDHILLSVAHAAMSLSIFFCSNFTPSSSYSIRVSFISNSRFSSPSFS